jgi:hypothetical protein
MPNWLKTFNWMFYDFKEYKNDAYQPVQLWPIRLSEQSLTCTKMLTFHPLQAILYRNWELTPADSSQHKTLILPPLVPFTRIFLVPKIKLGNTVAMKEYCLIPLSCQVFHKIPIENVWEKFNRELYLRKI